MSTDPVPVTSETEWLSTIGRLRLPPPDTPSSGRIAVVAAHPDDECLAVGGVLQTLHEQAADLRVIVATDGEAAYPSGDGAHRQMLGRRRRRELRAALRAHGLASVPVTWLGLADSGLTQSERHLRDRLRPLLAGSAVTIAPWRCDPHPDHQAAGRAASAVAPPECRVWSYPIWMWHWMRPDEEVIPWRRALLHRLSADQRARKIVALGEFGSQLSSPDGFSDPVLPPGVLAHFERDVEVLFEESR